MKDHRFPRIPPGLPLAQILGPLSHALELTEGQPVGHCLRCCYIGTRIGDALNLPEAEMDDLFYTLLLKDLGCSSNASQVSQTYLADDIAFKNTFKTLPDSPVAALRFVLSGTGPKADLPRRIRALANVLRNGGQIVNDIIETRCQRGAAIAKRLHFSPSVQDGISNLDEHWNGKGWPNGLSGEAIPLASRIALLSQLVDVIHHARGRKAAMDEVAGRSGGRFDPELVEIFKRLAKDPDFWADLEDPDIEFLVLSRGAALHQRPVNADFLDEVAAAFANVVDAKSRFTADHSDRVTLYTDMIATQLGHSAQHRRWLRRAALLHDLGKLGVSNQILDKPGALDAAEWQAIRAHPAAGSEILKRITAFADMAPIARSHHERLDGGGYPDGLTAEALPLDVRIVTVADVFDALSAHRPYRDALPMDEVFDILDRETGTAFDADCVAALKSGLGRLQSVRGARNA
ncbi:HD-GYP domain-containing protein [Salipiger sp. IMCC34102]|uniref:HD-GYP domain-containing protein n=1 Tax=Salipiger sp. IMCC34102 TaxID=2510647 RepID=UPI00101D33A0|nr:HD-GYP domain-containing protein [Salipiger sp. IMCC34102]RYH01632.1 HD-GYP domain-containing protein [Salipiger sp. IMCC34102]